MFVRDRLLIDGLVQERRTGVTSFLHSPNAMICKQKQKSRNGFFNCYKNVNAFCFSCTMHWAHEDSGSVEIKSLTKGTSKQKQVSAALVES